MKKRLNLKYEKVCWIGGVHSDYEFHSIAFRCVQEDSKLKTRLPCTFFQIQENIQLLLLLIKCLLGFLQREASKNMEILMHLGQ